MPNVASSSNVAPGANNRRVLIVEDEPVVANLARRGLDSAGFLTDVSQTGADGIVRVFAGGFDLVLLDWKLSDMTGGEVLRVIRGAGLAIPVMVLSGYDEREAAIAAGANAFERKPFRLTAMLPAIERLLASEAANVGELSRRIFSNWTGRTVALIDRVSATMVSDEARLDIAAHRNLLHHLGHALADPAATIPEFRAGANAVKLIVKARVGVDRPVLGEARRFVAVPPLDRTRLHDKILKIIDFVESAGRGAHPVREGLIAPEFRISPGYLGDLLFEQTHTSWDDWRIGAHVRDSVRAIAAGCRTIGAPATKEWGWSSRQHFYESFRKLIGVGPGAFRAILAAPPKDFKTL